MAGRKGFLESEAAAVRNICLKFHCVYARPHMVRGDGSAQPGCSIKYEDEVVMDFQEPDGCQVAASDEENSVIPGAMTTKGFKPFSGSPKMDKFQLVETITSARRPSGRRGGRVVFEFRLP